MQNGSLSRGSAFFLHPNMCNGAHCVCCAEGVLLIDVVLSSVQMRRVVSGCVRMSVHRSHVVLSVC